MAAPVRIGRFLIEREIGRGMMGVVYHASDPDLGRAVALKTIQLAFTTSESERKGFEKRFFAEARAAASLSHPGIVVVYEVGADPETGKLYMALEYLVGRTLADVVAAGRLEWRRALQIARVLADALHHAHSRGIIHRDVKPANVMLLDSGEPKIMDFGIAKLPVGALTTAGQVIGTPSYMSPERASDGAVDGRSDIFSLGTVLYEMLTGRRAFPGKDIGAILVSIAQENPAPASTLVPGLAPEIDAIVARCLAKAPADRYPTAQGLAEDLTDVLEGRPPRHLRVTAKPAPAAAPPPAAKPVPPAVVDPQATGLAMSSRQGLVLPAGRRVSLAIMDGGRRGDIHVMTGPSVRIGRSGGGSGADLEIPDAEVSRNHATVECFGQRIVLRDLESANGTFVAEEQVRERELENQDEFRVGHTRIMLIVSSEE